MVERAIRSFRFSDYGRLSSELFRAVRLVVDTGLHSEGWTRDQAVAFFRKEQCVDEPTIQAEVDRYIDNPAQALAYKLGQLKFLELRARAQKELGTQFDLRTFHDEMLSGGRLPLEMLDARTNAWIAAQNGVAAVPSTPQVLLECRCRRRHPRAGQRSECRGL